MWVPLECLVLRFAYSEPLAVLQFAMEVQSLNHWTTRGVPRRRLLMQVKLRGDSCSVVTVLTRKIGCCCCCRYCNFVVRTPNLSSTLLTHFEVHVRAQSRPTLCNPMGCSLPRSSVRGISQARILEWVAMPSSRGSSQPRD